MGSQDGVLELTGLRRRFGQVVALDGLSFTVAASAVISLASTVAMARVAGTLYERAILRTGARLKVRQILRSAAYHTRCPRPADLRGGVTFWYGVAT